jgi:GH15 family glucan-1,4-alpha-glucosidase
VPDRYPAIEDHAVIGDLHTVALVATDGTIDWCCLPRFDSPAAFASLLDSGHDGSFAVRSEAVRTRQLHKPGTNVLVTRFLGTGSVGEAVDFMVPRHPGTPLMRPGPLLVRRLRAVRGTVVFTITCRPAFYEPDGSDGLLGSEGTFNLCSFWYVEALTRAGSVAEGQYVFEKMLIYANHVGLFAEEIGPAGEALGNFPQAFTHLALIRAACNLDRALSGELPAP